MRGKIIIINPSNPNDFSIEKCEIYSVSSSQQYYKQGDTVIIDYTVFTVGKYKQGNMSGNVSTREAFKDGEDLIYWAYDGLDGFNESEIFGRIEADKIAMTPPMKDQLDMMQPGWYLIEKPQVIKKSKIIFWEEKDKRDKPSFSKIVASYIYDVPHRLRSNVVPGDEIVMAPDSSRPIYFDEKEYSVIKDIYVWGVVKKDVTNVPTQ